MAEKVSASVRNIRRGLPLRELTSLTSELKQPVEIWSKILGISPRTMLRKRARSSRLDSNISDRIERVKRIYALTQDAIGRDKAGLWLTRPNRVLHGQVPLALLDTDAGAQIVQEELYRIRYGILQLQLWRIYRAIHGPGLDGIGGLFASGRWNQPGHKVVYFSDTPSLAVLEKLVHLDPEFIDDDYLLGAFEIDVSVALVEDLIRLPIDWIGGDLTETAACGAQWLADGSESLLSVPSAIVPEQRNFLLNPIHRDAARLRPKRERPFRFDVRLLV